MNKPDKNTIIKDRPAMLVILDGFGYSPNNAGNAIAHAKMPFWNWLTQNYPHTLLRAAGQDVGLPPGYIGNSEVGHLTIGAGRIIDSILKKFHDEITTGRFFENKMLINNFNKLKHANTHNQQDKALHLIGLLSDGGVHSHESHLYAFLKLAKNLGLQNVFVHAILDGRDVAPKSAATYLDRLDAECKTLGCGKIASISGRFYAMDRDNNWDRTRQYYDMLVNTNPEKKPANTPTNWQTALDQAYSDGITDEFVKPILFPFDQPQEEPARGELVEPFQRVLKYGYIQPNDGIVFFNFRPDRARQLTESFINPNFDKFTTKNVCSSKLNLKNNELAFFITPTRYTENFVNFNNDVLFEREKITNTLLDVLAQQKDVANKSFDAANNPFKVFIITETEKYAHVTYFFHGMQDHQNQNETRVLIPSIKTENYINHPEMCANEITKTVLNSLKTAPADFYLINYANADMVGHSGDFEATVKACECLDRQLEQLYKVFVEKMDGTMFITADHGNAEEKIDAATGTPLTAHTQNPVPFIFINKEMQNKHNAQNTAWASNPEFGISNIAPTILNFVGLKEPEEMIKEKIEF